MEGVIDHVVSNLWVNETPFAMRKTLTNLFYSSSDARKLALRDKVRSIRMQKKNETISQYLSRFIEV